MKNVKIVTFVPETHADIVRKAMGDAGGGRIGNYSHCSFSVKGKGRFTPLAGSNPTIGELGKPEEVDEERIEMICEFALLDKVIDAMKSVHPYEEIAYDVYPFVEIEENK